MLAILKSPYPCIFGQKENVIAAVASGIFVAVFLLAFEPFGISESKDEFRNLKSIGYGFVTFFVMLFYYFSIPRLFTEFFDEKSYTLGKDIIASVGLILLIGLANGIYAKFFLNEPITLTLFGMMWQTFLVGIFPLTVLSLLQFNRQLKANLKTSEEIQLSAQKSQVMVKTSSGPKYFFISSEEEKKKIQLKDLLYLESKGNYAHLNQLIEGSVVRSLHRTTLKFIEEENTFPNIQRCHRSYIVNLNQVIDVSGNAQGLKLSLRHSEDVVPVSKKYIPVIKKYFSQ